MAVSGLKFTYLQVDTTRRPWPYLPNSKRKGLALARVRHLFSSQISMRCPFKFLESQRSFQRPASRAWVAQYNRGPTLTESVISLFDSEGLIELLCSRIHVCHILVPILCRLRIFSPGRHWMNENTRFYSSIKCSHTRSCLLWLGKCNRMEFSAKGCRGSLSDFPVVESEFCFSKKKAKEKEKKSFANFVLLSLTPMVPKTLLNVCWAPGREDQSGDIKGDRDSHLVLY